MIPESISSWLVARFNLFMNSWREWGIRNSFLYDKYGFKKEKFQSYSKIYGKKKKRKLSLYIF